MRPDVLHAIVLPCALAAALALGTAHAAGARAQPGLEELLVRVGERVAEFYKRAKNVICIVGRAGGRAPGAQGERPVAA